MKAHYDYLIVGAGLYGAMCAHELTLKGKKCLVVEKNDYIGGFCHSTNVNGIEVHLYGAHIFRTNSKNTWDFVNSICEFIPFVNSPLANYRGEIYNMPFNMNTFHQLWGVVTPSEAFERIKSEIVPNDNPCNLEEYVLSKVGRTIYDKLVKEYTEKQWGISCTKLPPSTMKRIPIRLTYDNNYYDARYQGIPEKGYTFFIERLLDGSDVLLNTDFIENRKKLSSVADEIIYTGAIDAFYDYCFGKLEYRSVRFEHEYLDVDNYQGNAVVNFTGADVPFTRIIEHKHFMNKQCKGTFISREYPIYNSGSFAPSYPINNERNMTLYEKYKSLASKDEHVQFKGRLAEYKYYSMNDIIEQFVC